LFGIDRLCVVGNGAWWFRGIHGLTVDGVVMIVSLCLYFVK